VVIGGGNVAMDAARTAARLQGTAGRPVNVTVTTLESREEMAAAAEEITEAEREGVTVINSRGPQQCRLDGSGERLLGLETARVASLKDENGRFHPKFDTGDTGVLEADLIIEAIGQTPELGFLGDELTERLQWQRGRPVVDTEGRTSEPWLWAVGDLVEGPDVVHAIAAGHRVAVSIHRQLATAGEVHP
jgi:glutamate synthase (NADPH/NADH) small chain